MILPIESLQDYHYFLKTYKDPSELDASKLLFFEINLLKYRTRIYSNVNLYIVQYLLEFANINNIIRPLYLHKPTLFFHAIYTTDINIINLFLKHNPKHHINNYYPTYSLLTALHTKHLPTIKSLIPYTDIHFSIDNTTPYKYAISNFKRSHPIHILFKYIHLHLHSIKLLINYSDLPIDTIKLIKTYLI